MEVEGGEEDEEGGAEDDRQEVVPEMVPEEVQVLWGAGGELGEGEGQEGDEEEVHCMGDEVVVT